MDIGQLEDLDRDGGFRDGSEFNNGWFSVFQGCCPVEEFFSSITLTIFSRFSEKNGAHIDRFEGGVIVDDVMEIVLKGLRLRI